MKSPALPVVLGVALGTLLNPSCSASVSFQIQVSGSSATAANIAPGGTLSLDVVATSIAAQEGVAGNLDAFTYRIAFPNEQFTLQGNSFAAPFDNAPAPGGFNGSIPWTGLPVAITLNADAGSPGSTIFFPDIYRTTATQPFNPVSGSGVVLETLSLRVPNSPADYPIILNILEAVDALGAFHSVDSGNAFLLTVVPEPAATVALAGLGLLGFVAFRRSRGPKS